MVVSEYEEWKAEMEGRREGRHSLRNVRPPQHPHPGTHLRHSAQLYRFRPLFLRSSSTIPDALAASSPFWRAATIVAGRSGEVGRGAIGIGGGMTFGVFGVVRWWAGMLQ